MTANTTSRRSTQAAGLAKLHRYTWWSMAFGAFVLLGMPLLHWAPLAPAPTWAMIATFAGSVVAFVGAMVLTTRRLEYGDWHESDPGARGEHRCPRSWAAAAMAGAWLSGGVMLALGEPILWSLGPALLISCWLMFVPDRRRWPLLLLTVFAMAALAAVGSTWTQTIPPLNAAVVVAAVTAFCQFVVLVSMWSWDVAARLDDARRVAAELAVADERLRFAADLHDIQGHHLQVIALKSELAARLSQSDPDAAAVHMRDVQRLATEALSDTRKIVQGFRQASLQTEITNAAKVLTAAGIETQMAIDAEAVSTIPERARRLLAQAIREATTNVLRHSRARRAEVHLDVTDGYARLHVRNDGVPAEPGPLGGLGALADRLGAEGGKLHWSVDAGWFTIDASASVVASAVTPAATPAVTKKPLTAP